MPDSFNFNKANLDQALMWIATQMRINPEARFVINIQHGATASGRGFDKYSSSKSFDPKKGFHRAETKESFSSSKKTFGSRQDDRASYVKTTSPASMYRKKTGDRDMQDYGTQKKFGTQRTSFGGDKKFGPRIKKLGAKKESKGGPKRKG